MSGENSFLTAKQIAQELEQDITIIRFILNRFEARLPAVTRENGKMYDRKLLTLFIFITENLNSGMTPAEIDTAIDNGSHKSTGFTKNAPDTPFHDFSAMEQFFSRFHENQEKLAMASERRTEVEERKAAAMEKRADAEKRKADAMNHIAMALHQIKNEAAGPDGRREIAEQTAAAVTGFEEEQEADDLLSLIKDLPEESDHAGRTLPETPELDDLSALAEELETPGGNGTFPDEEELGDLAELLDEGPAMAEEPGAEDIDDLAMLLDEQDETLSEGDETDDLNLLIQAEDREDEIIEPDVQDDLSALIDEDTPDASLIPDISPDEDFEGYKQAIINIIIGLKDQGLTPEETCERFNKEGIRTLSGKSRWSVKTISGIYRFINSAA
ncbi:MAG: hypothetical protein R6V41_08510 [Desulfobacteraceae bacterium]